jgi:hypothetical protein
MLLPLAVPCLTHPQSTNEGSRREIPVLQSTCLITADVRRLVEFYEPLLNRKANWSGEDYAEFPTRAGVLAIFSAAAQEKYIPGSAEPATNRSVILEFKVADVAMGHTVHLSPRPRRKPRGLLLAGSGPELEDLPGIES